MPVIHQVVTAVPYLPSQCALSPRPLFPRFVDCRALQVLGQNLVGILPTPRSAGARGHHLLAVGFQNRRFLVGLQT